MRVHALVADLVTARRAVAAGATVVQLRVKAPTIEVVERGRGFRELEVTFIVNDDVDAAFELGADGVHLGYSDEGVDRVREQGMIVGRSAASVEQAQAMAREGADYLGVGPIWSTPSKDDADPPLGLAGLRLVCAEVPRLAVIAIGGVDASNAADCIRAGAAGVAAIRAATDPHLREAVDEALGSR